MSKFASKYNKGGKFNINTSDFNYERIKDLYNNNGEEYGDPLTAIYINNKSKFGDSPVFATDNFFVNIPEYMLDVSYEILADDESIDAINNGEVGFTIYTYTDKKFNKECFGVKFVDIEN